MLPNRWLAVRLGCLGNVIVFLSAIFAVVARPSASIVGLSISYALSVTDVLSWVVRIFSEVETNVVAVERIKEYGETPQVNYSYFSYERAKYIVRAYLIFVFASQEAPWEIPEKKPPPVWPSKGAINFNNYQTRYRDCMDLVLRDVTFSIRPGDKVC